MKDYKWGERDREGWRSVHSMMDGRGGGRLMWVPREFDVVGILDKGLQCELGSFEALSRSEPKGLLVGLGEEKKSIFEVCDRLSGGEMVENYASVGEFTRGDGVVLTFPSLLEVSAAITVEISANEM